MSLFVMIMSCAHTLEASALSQISLETNFITVNFFLTFIPTVLQADAMLGNTPMQSFLLLQH